MYKEILDIIVDYYNKHLPVDDNYIKEVSSIIIKHLELQDYVKNVVNVEISKNEFNAKGGSYDYFEKKIEIDIKQNLNLSKNLINRKKGFFEPHEEELLNIIMVTISILHEFKHALQYRLLHEGNKDSVEAKLLSASLKGVRKTNGLTIIKNAIKIYNIPGYGRLLDSTNPCERMATLYSHLEMLNILEEISHTIEHLITFISRFYITEELYPYELDGVSDKGPSYSYLEAYNKEKIWKTMPFYDKNNDILLANVMEMYDIDKRMYYGLPVTCGELMLKKRKFDR